MRVFLFILCLGLTILCNSQTNDPRPQTEEERQIVFKNKVKSYSITFYEMEGKSRKKTTDFEKVEYDEEGYLTKEEIGWREPQDVNIETVIYRYNEKNQLLEEYIREYDFDGEVKEIYEDKTLYEYDKDGNLVRDCWYTKEPDEKDFILEDCITYEYVNGMLTTENNGTDKYIFENNGDTIVKRDKQTNQIISKELNGHSIYFRMDDTEWYYFYDAEGLLLKGEYWKKGVRESVSEMEYKKKLLHQIISKNKDMKITEIEVYAYQYYK